MSDEANSSSRVVTIVQSSIPLAAATALDNIHTVHTEELPYGLGQQEKNPFSNFSEEHLNRIDDFLSTEEAQKILQQTTVDYNNSGVTGQSSLNDDTDAGGDRSEDLLNIFDNKGDDQAELGTPFSDHAYAIPVKRVTRTSVPAVAPQEPPVTFPLIPTGSPRKRQLQQEALIVADVGNMVEISVEDSKPGKGRGRGRKSQGDIPLGNSSNRRSSRISDNEQREMAEKIRRENLQKEKEEMEAITTGQVTTGQFDEAQEETPKKRGRGRPPKRQEADEETKQVSKNGKTKASEESDEESEEDSESEEEEEEDDDDDDDDSKNKRKKGKKKNTAQESESEEESSPKVKGQKRGPKSRTKKQANDADDESENASPKRKGKGKKLKGKKGKKGSAENESESESPMKKGKKIGKKNKKEESDSESEDETPKKGKNKAEKDMGKKKKGKGMNVEVKSPMKKGKKGKAKTETEESTDTDNVKKKGKSPKKGKKKKDESSDESEPEKSVKNSAKKNMGAKKGMASKAKNNNDAMSSSEDEPLIAMKSDKKAEQSKTLSAGKNIFDALASVGKSSDGTIKRKHSESENNTSDIKKGKFDKVKAKHENGEEKSSEGKKNEHESKTAKVVKKKYRKSEDFLDMTMTDLFKPDGVIPNEDDHKHEQVKAGDIQEKHTDDSAVENQSLESVCSKDKNDAEIEVENAPEQEKNIFESLKNVQIESEENKNEIEHVENEIEHVENEIKHVDQTNEIEHAEKANEVEQVEKENKVEHAEKKKCDSPVVKIDDTIKGTETSSVIGELKNVEDVEQNIVTEKSDDVSKTDDDIKEPVITKEDENMKIKQMYKRNTEKELNSSIDSDHESVTVSMDTSTVDEMEPIQFEATIENIDLVDLSSHMEESHGFIENVGEEADTTGSGKVESKGEKSVLSEVNDSEKEDKLTKKIEEETKQETEKDLKTKKTGPHALKETVKPRGGRGRGRVVQVKSDVESSDVTGSEVEEDGRALRRKRARNPLVEEFLKKEKGKRKKAKSEDEETDKESEEKVKKKGKEKVSTEVEKAESEEESEEESDEDISSGEEYEPPDKLYCICNKPYNNQFMICCDSCENWYHGKCVGISQARGKEMEDNKEDYICDKCKEKDKIDEAKGKDKVKGEGKQKHMVVKMPGLVKKDKLEKKMKVKLKTEANKSQNSATDKKTESSVTKTGKVMKLGSNKGETVIQKTGNKSEKDTTPSKKVVISDKPQIIVLKKGVPLKSEAGKDASASGKGVGKANSTTAKGDKNTPGKSVKEDKTGGIFTPDKAKVIAQPKKSGDQKKPEDKLPRCIGPKCGKPARSDSVYCSNECIINHSQDSLNIIHSQQEPVVKKKSKLTGHKRIVVIEKTTGKILTGDKAPTEAELCAWLERNPSYSVLCPTIKKPKHEGEESEKPKDSSSSNDSKHSSHHSNKDHHSDKKHHKDGNKERKSDSSQERRKSDSSREKDKKSHSHKHSDKHSSQNRKESSKTPAKSDGSKASARSDSSSSKASARSDSSSSKTLAKSDTSSSKKEGTKPEDAGPDPVRLNVRKSLRDALASRAEKADDVMLSLSEIKSLALDIENELFGYFKDSGHKYKNKYRSLIFNIKDVKNKGLFRKILNGELKPTKLVKMTPDELASRELAKWREFETKHELDMIVQAEKETQKEGVHFVKKTHKGEEIMDDKEDMSTLEDHGVEKSKVKETKTEKSAVDFIGGLIGDTTSQHKNHLFDLNCRICTGKEAPPMKDTTPKKVRVAHKVRIEEPSSSDKKVTIKSAEDNKKAEDIVKEVLKAVQKAKKEQMEEEARLAKEQKHQEPVPDPSEGIADSTVIVRSPDSALQSGLEQKPDFTPKGPQVWKGFISMQDVAKFVTTAYRVSGPSDKLNIPDTIHVCGRISPDQVFDYLAKMRKVGTKDIIVLRFIPGPNEEKTSYISLYSYLNSRTRCGVVGSVSKYIKDFYILPLASHSKIPTVIRPFVEQGLERNRPHMLLAVIVRQKVKSHASEVDVSRDPRQKNKNVEKTKQQEKRSYTPPGQKSYGPLPKIPKISKSGTDTKTKQPVSATATSSTVSLTTSPTTRGSSSTGDPIVEVYGTETDDGDDVEPYDPEKPTMSEVPMPKKADDDTVFKKPLMPAPRSSPSSSPGGTPSKTIAGAATMIAQMMDKLKATTSAEGANEVITDGLSPMVTITDKQKLLLELTQRVCEQKKLIELKHAGKPVQESVLPLIAVANAMTAISQISKTLVTAPKRPTVVPSQIGAKSASADKEVVSSATTSETSSVAKSSAASAEPITSPSITSTTANIEISETMVASDLYSSDISSTNTRQDVVLETNSETLPDRSAGLLPHEVAAESGKMSTMPEALKSLFSSIPGSYSHVTKYKEEVPVKAPEKSEEESALLDEQKSDNDNIPVSQSLPTQNESQESNGGKSKLFNVSLLEFDYGDSDSDAEETKASTTPADDNENRPPSVMSSSSEESQDSAHIAPLQYPPLPEEPAMLPPLPAEPLPPPPDHAPEDEKSEDEDDEGGRKGKKKKKKKKKDRKGKAVPQIILEAKDPISKAILDASFRRLMGQQEPIPPQIPVPMPPVVGAQPVPMSDPSVQINAMAGQIAAPPFQSPATPGIMGPVPVPASMNNKPPLLPTPGGMVPPAPPMIAQSAPIGMPPSAPIGIPQTAPIGIPPNVISQPPPTMPKPIPSLFDVEVKPSRNLDLSKLEDEPENELDRELRDLADADWKTNDGEAQDLDLRQDQDLRSLMDIDLRPTFNIPPKIPTQVKWPEDVDHRKSGRFTPDPVFGSNVQLPSEDSDLRNFCSPLDQDYRRRDMPPKPEVEDQDFRMGNSDRHGNRRGSHDHDHYQDREYDRGRRRRHDDSSYHRKSKRRRRDDDRRHSRHDSDRDNYDKDYRNYDNNSEQSNEHSDKNNEGIDSGPKDIDQRQNEDKKVIPPPPRLADRVPVPPPQVLAQKSSGDKPPKPPPMQPPPLPPGIEVKHFTSVAPPQKPAQPPPPGIDDW